MDSFYYCNDCGQLTELNESLWFTKTAAKRICLKCEAIDWMVEHG